MSAKVMLKLLNPNEMDVANETVKSKERFVRKIVFSYFSFVIFCVLSVSEASIPVGLILSIKSSYFYGIFH